MDLGEPALTSNEDMGARQEALQILPSEMCETKAVPCALSLESHQAIRYELDSLQSHLMAQARAIESLNRTLTMLQMEGSQQQRRLRAMEDDFRRSNGGVKAEMLELLVDRRVQDVWRAVSIEVGNLQEYIEQKADDTLTCRSDCIEDLAEEIHESKKFLWEELESVRGEIQQVNQKLIALDEDLLNKWTKIMEERTSQEQCNHILCRLVSDCGSQGPSAHGALTEQELETVRVVVNELQAKIEHRLCSKINTSPSFRTQGKKLRRRKQVDHQPVEREAVTSDSDVYETFSLGDASSDVSSSECGSECRSQGPARLKNTEIGDREDLVI